MKLVSVRLLVVDFATEMRFWRDVIGLKMAFGDEASGYAYFETGSTAGLELFGRDAFAVVLGRPVPAPARGNEAIVSFEVDDVDAAYADFVRRGATQLAGPNDREAWGVRAAHMADPEGHVIELFTRLPR